MDKIRIFVAGDLSIHPNSPLPHLKPKLSQLQNHADLGFVNLESAINPPHSQPVLKSGPTISTHHQTPEFLKKSNLNLISLANNHIMDYAWDSALFTRQGLIKFKLKPFGIGHNLNFSHRPIRFSFKKYKFSLFAFAEPEFGFATSTTSGYAPAIRLKRTISKESNKRSIVIVSIHGGPEEALIPSPRQVSVYRSLVDAGAKLVIGHHSHTPLPFEKYKSGVIVYSLGNYYFNQPMPKSTYSDFGLAGIITISGNKIGFQPYYLKVFKSSVGLFQDFQISEAPARSYYHLLQRYLASGDFNKLYDVYAHDFATKHILPFLATQAYNLKDMLMAKINFILKGKITPPQAQYLVYLQNLIINPSHHESLHNYFLSSPSERDIRRYHSLNKNFQRIKSL